MGRRKIKRKEPSLTKITEAKNIMLQAHEGQKRWDGSPYSTHPEKVVEILRGMGINNEDILCSAYLHDILEDTEYPEEAIEQEFGFPVIYAVKRLTFPPKCTDEEYWEKCSDMPFNARIIKIADILANLGDKGRKSEHFVQKRTKALQILLKGIVS